MNKHILLLICSIVFSAMLAATADIHLTPCEASRVEWLITSGITTEKSTRESIIQQQQSSGNACNWKQQVTRCGVTRQLTVRRQKSHHLTCQRTRDGNNVARHLGSTSILATGNYE